MSDEKQTYSLDTVTSLTAATIYDGNTIEAIIDAIEKEVRSEVPDISNDKGRKRVISLAAKVASSKVALDNMGKELVAGWKAQSKLVDADRKLMRDRLDALKVEIRQPVTDWEEAAAKRIEDLQKRVAVIAELGKSQNEEGESYPLSALKSRLEDLQEVVIDESFEEFKLDAMETKEAAMAAIAARIADLEEQARKDAELEELRRKEEERAQKERDEAIAKEAAEKAAREERERIEKENEQKEQERLAAIREKEEAEQRLKEEQERAEREAKEAEERAKREQEEAVERERKRVAVEEAAAKEEEAKRAADKEHKRKLNKEALECFKQGGLDDDAAKLAVELIAKKMIANVTINY
jgi:hypothetical protein